MAAHNTRFSCDTSVSSRLDRGALGRLGLVERGEHGASVGNEAHQSRIEDLDLAELLERIGAQAEQPVA